MRNVWALGGFGTCAPGLAALVSYEDPPASGRDALAVPIRLPTHANGVCSTWGNHLYGYTAVRN